MTLILFHQRAPAHRAISRSWIGDLCVTGRAFVNQLSAADYAEEIGAQRIDEISA
jgi:hypothetical protein